MTADVEAPIQVEAEKTLPRCAERLPPTPLPLRVVYIAGYGRSGSTVLGVVLGHGQAAIGVGELTVLAGHVWGHDEYCSCGRRVRACPLWSRIVRRWLGDEDSSAIERYHRLLSRTEGLLALGGVLLGLYPGRRQLEEYASYTERLYRAIAEESGATVIIDSSKAPGRALALSLIPGIDLRVIHLVRDGRGVAWSNLKRFPRNVRAGLQKEIRPRSMLRTAAKWMLVNVATELVCRRLGEDRCLRVRYEDLTMSPETVIARLGHLLALDTREINARLVAREALDPGHQVAGNRIRMRKSISIVSDNTWIKAMPSWRKSVFDCVCFYFQKRYGYR